MVIHSRSASDHDLPYALLAEHLFSLRWAARLTQRALAEAASISRNTVQRAESGTVAPSPPVLSAYVRACRGDADDLARAKELRNRGRAAARNRLGALNAPALDHIRTRADLATALAAVYERGGAPSLRECSVPTTTAWRIVNGKGLPANGDQLFRFLIACGVTPVERHFYVNAYTRLRARRHERPLSQRPRRRARGVSTSVRVVTTGQDERYELTGRAAAIARQLPTTLIDELLVTALTQMAGREAYRNGAAVPEAWSDGQLITRCAGRHIAVFQFVGYQGTDPSPEDLDAHAPPNHSSRAQPAMRNESLEERREPV
ncbi:helix-turn-helix domain-containing protein [Streptomyces javensis]|uniref:Helix-turn-helix transcriptional regulator n=1 Tax=Streptomyces javensis TaxID=114698 RepID=A0ABS0R822_9ACTN|nr:helix-turn-helix transcriptional regulator [Streptomyces javensis]MBI0312892.1 helix-turn-helix transcriptional regulator [Streptomyces javensis]